MSKVQPPPRKHSGYTNVGSGGGGGETTGQAATVYSATNARQVTRYKTVTTFPVFSVVTT